jgi:hypothetical protein
MLMTLPDWARAVWLVCLWGWLVAGTVITIDAVRRYWRQWLDRR